MDKVTTKEKTIVKKTPKEETSASIETVVYNQKGQQAGKVSLPGDVFGAKWNADLVHQVTVGMQSNKRAGTASAKDRGAVSGGGKKPWKQKGTGRARHGSSRSPIWVGGGVTHGPLAEKSYKKKINKKMRVKALYSVLSEKFRKEKIIFIDKISFSEMKTKEADTVLKNISKIDESFVYNKDKKTSVIFAINSKDDNIVKSFSNIPRVKTMLIESLSPVDVLSSRYLVIVGPEEASGLLVKRAKKADSKEDTKKEE